MSIKKSALALAATAIAMMGFASPTMAVDGVIKDVNAPEGIIPESTVLHLVGWVGFENENGDGIKCHATSNVTPTNTQGTTGHATFSVPNVANCDAFGALDQCTVTSVTYTNAPYHLTVTPPGAGIPAGDLDITGSIVDHNALHGFLCPSQTTTTYSSITLKPLKTGTRVVTGTANTLGTTAALNDPIAGFELHGEAISHIFGLEDEITVTGELEITGAGRCTWKIASS